MKAIYCFFALTFLDVISIFSQNISLSDVSLNIGYSYPLGKYKEVASFACAGLDSKGSALPNYAFSVNGNFTFTKSIKIATVISYFENKINNKQIYENSLNIYHKFNRPTSGNWKNIYLGIGPKFEICIHKNIMCNLKIISGLLQTTYPETKIYFIPNDDHIYATIKSTNSISPFLSFGIEGSIKLIDNYGLTIKSDWLYLRQNFNLKSTITNIKSKQSINTLNTTIGLIYYI